MPFYVFALKLVTCLHIEIIYYPALLIIIDYTLEIVYHHFDIWSSTSKQGQSLEDTC